MFIKEYSTTDVQRMTKIVFIDAAEEPVRIRRPNNEALIIMDQKEYERLLKAAKEG